MMILEHTLAIQPLLHLVGVGHWDHLSPAVFRVSIQCLVIGDGACWEVTLTAKGKEKLDHILWAGVLPLLHVDLDSRLDRFLSRQEC